MTTLSTHANSLTDYAFPIPADYCIVLKAMHESASLREAALLLDMDAGALARKVQKIATEFGLLYKTDNKWLLTEPGVRLVSWVGESQSIQRSLLSLRQTCRISSTNWLVEKMLLGNHRRILERTQNKYQLSYLNTSSSLETEVLSGRTDFAISLQAPYSPEICYKRIRKFAWRVIFPKSVDASELVGKTTEQTMAYLSERFDQISVVSVESVAPVKLPGRAALEVDDHLTLLKAVERELGWGLVPEILVGVENEAVGSLPLEQDTQQTVNIWWIRSRKDLAQLAEVLLSSF